MIGLKRNRLLALLLVTLLNCSAMTPAWSDILVFGGTGQLGARIVHLLRDAGEDVTVFVRPTSDRSPLDGLGVDYVVGDLLNEADVAAAFESASYRAVIVAVRVPVSVAGFYETANRHITRYAPAAGVMQIISHGAVGAGDNMAMHPDIPWSVVPGLSERMEDRGRAEALLMNSDIGVTIIRNSRVWPNDTPSTGHAELSEDQRTLTPITRADLARFTMDCLDNLACANKIYHARDTSLSWPPPQPESGSDINSD